MTDGTAENQSAVRTWKGERMFNIDKMSRVPIYEQFMNQFEQDIILGKLKPDEKVPSVRSLSVDLSVNPNTLQKAYAELERRELCYSVPGSGRFISPNAAELIRKRKFALLDEIVELCNELKLFGIDINTVKEAVDRAYEKN